MRPVRKTVPVNLIADGRHALVVGYGKVGRRKECFLHDCGVPVTVVSPDAETGPVQDARTVFVRRAFEAGDCKGALIVFACTGDKHVNRAVLEDARRCGVPCCCSDMNWADGDFTTPAVVRSGSATVAVSTSGASCSTAKELRSAIAGCLSSRSDGRIMVIGTSDRNLPAERRAAFHLPPEARREMARFLFGVKGVEGLVVLNTCNRVEVALHGGVDVEFVKRLMRFHRLSPGEYFLLDGDAAFRHLVKVTAGLESAWAGEFHVVSQMKSAVEESAEAGMLSGRLKGFFDDVFHAAKEVRGAVEGMLDVKEVETTVADYLASKIDLPSSRVAVLGTGKIGASVAAGLKAGSVVAVHHGDPIPRCDALVCALAAGEPVVTEPIPGCLVVDLGMPPNCSPRVGAVSLDDLKNWRRAETGALDAAMALADSVIDSEVERMSHRIGGR